MYKKCITIIIPIKFLTLKLIPSGFPWELCIRSPSCIYQEQSNWSILTGWHSSTVFRAVQSGQEIYTLNYVVIYQLNSTLIRLKTKQIKSETTCKKWRETSGKVLTARSGFWTGLTWRGSVQRTFLFLQRRNTRRFSSSTPASSR